MPASESGAGPTAPRRRRCARTPRLAAAEVCRDAPLEPAPRGHIIAEYAADGRRKPGLLPQGRRLPVGLPGAHERPRIHPADRAGPVHRRLHPQSRVERLPGHPRTHVRPAVRAGLPPHPRRRQARRHLPPEARRRGPPGRRHATASRRRRRSKNGKKIALIGAGPASLTVANDLMPLGYQCTIFEKRPRPGRPDAHQHPRVPPARGGARRGDRLHRRHGRRDALRHAGRRA